MHFQDIPNIDANSESMNLYFSISSGNRTKYNLDVLLKLSVTLFILSQYLPELNLSTNLFHSLDEK